MDMLHENLKTIRKDRGLSQEELAVRLNVVRQTISKWEKGLSVPDAEMLIKISEILDVSVSDLLGQSIAVEQKCDSLEAIAVELKKLNELLAMQQSRRKEREKKIRQVLGTLLLILFLLAIYEQWNEMFYEFGQNIYHWFHE